MTSTGRLIQFKIMLSDEEKRIVDMLADVSRVSTSDVVRMLIRREYEGRRLRWDDVVHVLADRKAKALDDILREMNKWGPTARWGATPTPGDVSHTLSELVAAGLVAVAPGGKYRITPKGGAPAS